MNANIQLKKIETDQKTRTVFVSENSIFYPEENYLELVLTNGNKTHEYRHIISPKITPEVVKKAGYQILNPIQAAFYLAMRKWFKNTTFSAICAAPTSSGKTGIILTYLDHFLNIHPKGIAVYISPRTALAREKFQEFQKIFGNNNVEIKTGDNPDTQVSRKPILVCTPDYLSLSIRNSSSFIKEIKCIIIDEVHTLFNQIDQSKSPIDEVLWFTKEKNIPFLLLSATIPLLKDMTEFYQPDLLLQSTWQPVPLEKRVLSSFQEKNLIFDVETDCLFSTKECKDKCPLISLDSYPGKEGKIKPQSNDFLRLAMLRNIMRSFARKEGKKALIFVHSKDNGWKLLELLTVFCRFKTLNSTDYLPFDLSENTPTQDFTTAFYCADLDPVEKITIEKKFLKDDNFPILITTTSLAYGVNLPADTVLIPVIPIRDNGLTNLFIPDIIDCTQMAGRAGRYGMTKKGKVYFIVRTKDTNKISESLFEISNYPYKEILKNKSITSILANSILLSIKKKSPLAGIPHLSFLVKEAEVSYNDIFRYKGILDSLHYTTENEHTKEPRLTVKGEYCLTSGISPFILEKVLKLLFTSKNIQFKNPDEKEYFLLLTTFYISGILAESTYKNFLEKRKISIPFKLYELPESHIINRMMSSSYGVYYIYDNYNQNTESLVRENNSVLSLFLLTSGAYFFYGLPKPFADLSYITLATKNYITRNLLSFIDKFSGFPPGLAFYALHVFNHQLRGSALLLFLALKSIYKEKLRFGYFKKNLLALTIPFIIPPNVDAISSSDFLQPTEKIKTIVKTLKSNWEVFEKISKHILHVHKENRMTFFNKKIDAHRFDDELEDLLKKINDFITDCELSNYENIEDHKIYNTEICELVTRTMGKRFQDNNELKKFTQNYFKLKQIAF